jgi:hypothetical protein
MLKFNKLMAKHYRKSNVVNYELNNELQMIVGMGLFQVDELVFLKKLYQIDTNVMADNFIDNTGYECFINSLHIDDYVNDNYLEQAIIFTNHIFKKFRLLEIKQTLVCIMSLDEIGLTIKFHLSRENESFLNKDLNGYEEAVLIVDSSEENW